jgi:hypothetical protein
MEQPWEIERVETSAGTYTVEIWPDYDPAIHPLEDDDEAFAAIIEYSGYGGRWDQSVDTLKSAGRAGEVLRELLEQHGHDDREVGRRWLKWAAIAGSPWLLGMGGQNTSGREYYRYAILANRDLLTRPEEAIKSVMADYHTYADGAVVGFVTKAPNGQVIEAVLGFYDQADAISQGTDVARRDAEARVELVNLAGAGITGIV